MQRVVTISKDYLLIPVKKGAEKKLVSFWCKEEKLYEFEISFGLYEYGLWVNVVFLFGKS